MNIRLTNKEIYQVLDVWTSDSNSLTGPQAVAQVQLKKVAKWLGYRCFQHKNAAGEDMCCFYLKQWQELLKEAGLK